MVLDLGDLDFICSLGLGSIVAVYLRAMKHGGRVVVSRPAPAIREMLELTRLTHLLTVYDTVDAALAARA
jgi:anti-anti-sigma factor